MAELYAIDKRSQLIGTSERFMLIEYFMALAEKAHNESIESSAINSLYISGQADAYLSAARKIMETNEFEVDKFAATVAAAKQQPIT